MFIYEHNYRVFRIPNYSYFALSLSTYLWKHASVFLWQGKLQLWANCFMCWMPVARQDLRDNTATHCTLLCWTSLISKFMGPTWGPSGADRTQVSTMLAPWTLLSGALPVGQDVSVKTVFVLTVWCHTSGTQSSLFCAGKILIWRFHVGLAYRYIIVYSHHHFHDSKILHKFMQKSVTVAALLACTIFFNSLRPSDAYMRR